MTSIYSLSRLFAEIIPEHTVAHLAGGDFSSQDMCIEIIELLQNKGIKIANADLVRQSFDSASMAIDSRTGAIYSPIQHYQLNQTPDINFRLQIAGLQFSKSPIKQCYNGLTKPKAAALQVVESPAREMNRDVSPKEYKLSSSLSLGFLTLEKDRQKKTTQLPQQTYCGFKPGFLTPNHK